MGGGAVSFHLFSMFNLYVPYCRHFFYSFKGPEYALSRFRSIKGSCLAAPRFWGEILPKGWRFFSKRCMTLGLGQEHVNTFALEMGQKQHTDPWSKNCGSQ